MPKLPACQKYINPYNTFARDIIPFSTQLSIYKTGILLWIYNLDILEDTLYNNLWIKHMYV